MAYRLLGANVSPYVRKCRAYCAEKGIAYTHESVSPFAPPPNFRELSPLGKIPVLLDGDRPIADSTVICLYLERCHPVPPLYPGDNYEYARALWLEEFMDGGFLPVAGPQVFRPLVLAPMMSKQPVTPETKAEALAVVNSALHPMWDYLEETLGEHEFFVAGKLSIADLSVASAHVNLRHAGVEPTAARWPHLSAFLARMWARPSFAPLLAEEAERWDKREVLRAL
jgi:glutathione S-transferase